MLRVSLAILVILSFANLSGADAANKRKKPKVRPAPVGTLQAPAMARTPGPSWAGPNECFTDEGYGRYWPCGGGKE
jgi:hypothetical protein